MKSRISMVTLGVGDIEKSAHFYEKGLGLKRLAFDADAVFFNLEGTWLGLYPKQALAEDANVDVKGEGFSGVTLSHNVASKQEVDTVILEALNAGATLKKQAQDVFWGGYSGYFADLDGHLWEVAWNPHMWVGPEKHWDILKSQVPAENTLTIRYEQLVAQPEQVLGDICHWLGIEFNPSMLNIDNDTSYSKPDPKYAQQWKTKLSDKERGWVEYRCGDLMKKRGYTPFCSQITRPSVLSLFSIKLQSRLYRIKNNIKNWGFSTWLTHIITKRVGPKALSIRAQQRIDNITILNLK